MGKPKVVEEEDLPSFSSRLGPSVAEHSEMSKYMGAGSSTQTAIIMRNAVQKSLAFTQSLSSSQPRVRSLQRDVLRTVPWAKQVYGVPMDERKMRSLLTGMFRAKRDVSDMTQINRLISAGRMELEEVLQLWKGSSHLNNLFDSLEEQEQQATVPKASFLDEFYAGK